MAEQSPQSSRGPPLVLSVLLVRSKTLFKVKLLLDETIPLQTRFSLRRSVAVITSVLTLE